LNKAKQGKFLLVTVGFHLPLRLIGEGQLDDPSWSTLLLLDGQYEERPISAQPHLWGCYRNGPG